MRISDWSSDVCSSDLSYRRFIQMYADVVMGLDHAAFEEALEIAKEDKGFYLDTEMAAEDWQALVAEYRAIVQRETGAPFPQEPKDQLWGAIGALFAGWESDSAQVYRRKIGRASCRERGCPDV